MEAFHANMEQEQMSSMLHPTPGAGRVRPDPEPDAAPAALPASPTTGMRHGPDHLH
jgi:hypothetical protein